MRGSIHGTTCPSRQWAQRSQQRWVLRKRRWPSVGVSSRRSSAEIVPSPGVATLRPQSRCASSAMLFQLHGHLDRTICMRVLEINPTLFVYQRPEGCAHRLIIFFVRLWGTRLQGSRSCHTLVGFRFMSDLVFVGFRVMPNLRVAGFWVSPSPWGIRSFQLCPCPLLVTFQNFLISHTLCQVCVCVSVLGQVMPDPSCRFRFMSDPWGTRSC